MNLSEVIVALLNGKKVRHAYFLEGEWLQIDREGKIIDEEDCFRSFKDFKDTYQNNEAFNKDWSVIEPFGEVSEKPCQRCGTQYVELRQNHCEVCWNLLENTAFDYGTKD